MSIIEDKEEEEEYKRSLEGEDPIAQALKREAVCISRQPCVNTFFTIELIT